MNGTNACVLWMHARTSEMHARTSGMYARTIGIDACVPWMHARMTGVQQRVPRMHARMREIHARIERMHARTRETHLPCGPTQIGQSQTDGRPCARLPRRRPSARELNDAHARVLKDALTAWGLAFLAD
jgi:hypothetical protein